MANRLAKWWSKSKKKDDETFLDDGTPPTFPALPSQRPSILTPSSSQESLALEATSSSLFFQKLPPELRRRILKDAFGGHRVHIDLIYDHIPQQQAASVCGHGNLPLVSRDVGDTDLLQLDTKSPKKWLWRGSVCHRDSPNPGPEGHRIQPAHDQCRFGVTGSETCNSWPGTKPGKCQIGVLGWLQSCRQAYVEGIDVLYSTNTFHTASKPILLNASDVLLRQRLERISSVELIWEIEEAPIWSGGGGQAYKTMRSFWDFLDAAPKLFPNARSMHISIQWKPQYKIQLPVTMSENYFGYAEGGILDRVETMARRLGPHVQDFSLAIPSSMYRPRRDRARRNGQKVEQVWKGGQLERYFHPVRGALHRDGYWIRLGLRDILMPRSQETIDSNNDPRLLQEDWIMFEPAG